MKILCWLKQMKPPVLQLKKLSDWSQGFVCFMVDNITGYIQAKSVNENIVEKIVHNEYNDVLFSNKCIRHSKNRVQIKDHRIENYKIKKIVLIWWQNIYPKQWI